MVTGYFLQVRDKQREEAQELLKDMVIWSRISKSAQNVGCFNTERSMSLMWESPMLSPDPDGFGSIRAVLFFDAVQYGIHP
jgi:hypothetical protein